MNKDFKDFYYLLENQEQKQLDKTINYLSKKKKVLLIGTSNRPSSGDEVAKSTRLAQFIQQKLADKAVFIDASKLNISDCTGHVSFSKENNCGVKDALLKDKEKNPSGCLRCWSSFYNKEDELWKIVKVLFESDTIVFFGSVRWGQTNAVYQRLIERLTWLENRHTTLKESNIIEDIDAGIILTGQNWNGAEVIEIQKKVLKFFGFKVPSLLSWNWQYTNTATDESQESYKDALPAFKKDFGL